MKTPPNEVMVRRYRAGLGKIAGRMILLLTTIGRKSGKPHTVAVQYEKMGNKYYIGAATGQKSDWYRNILTTPEVDVEIGSKKMRGTAEPMVGEENIADFMVYRLKKHPLMIGLILKMDGCSFRPTRRELLEYSRRITVVTITPVS
jgi:deazaflavin-dependent oxidoreductase (nitroreductase family)